MGTIVIGGMLAASSVDILIVPALFVLVERMAKRGDEHDPIIAQPSPSEAD